MLRLAIQAMATRFEVVVAVEDGDQVRARAAAEAALEAIAGTEAHLSRFEPASFVSRLNRVGANEALRTDPLDREWLVLVDALRRETRSAFDPCWIRGGQLVLFDPRAERVGLDAPDTTFDAGAFGKGVALDRAAEELVAGGVRRALLHGGTSTVLALDPPPGRDAWGVRVEFEANNGRARDVELVRGALSVSAQRGHDRLPEGGHVVDARTGIRAAGEAVVACTAPRATLADAWSTALLAAGSPGRLVAAAARAGVRPLAPPPG